MSPCSGLSNRIVYEYWCPKNGGFCCFVYEFQVNILCLYMFYLSLCVLFIGCEVRVIAFELFLGILRTVFAFILYSDISVSFFT